MAGVAVPVPVEATALLDALDAIVWVADAATLRVSFVNRPGPGLLGYPHQRWLDDPGFWSSIIHEEDRAAMVELCRSVKDGGPPHERVHRVIDSAGVIKWFRTKVRVLPVATGRDLQLMGEMVEVTNPVPQSSAVGSGHTWLELLLRQAPAIIWTLDRDLHFTSGAGAGLVRLGLQPEQFLGVGLADFLVPGDPNSADLASHLSALQGQPVHFRGNWLGRIYDSYVEPLYDGEEIIGVIGIAVDVTERTIAEAERRKTEVRYQQIVETSEEGIWVVDAEGRTTFANRTMADLLGSTVQQLLGGSLFDAVAPALRDEARENLLHRAQAVRERHTVELVRGDGTNLPVEMATSAIYDEQGQFVGALAMVSDITARRQAETERERLLREVEARRKLLEVIVEHAPNAIVLLRGPDFRVEVANPAARAMGPGRSVDGLRWYEDVMPELAATVKPEIEAIMRSGRPASVTDQPMRVRRSPGGPFEQVWITASRVPVPLPDGEPGMLLLFVDTTAKVLADREIQRLAAASHAQAAQMKAIFDHMTEAVTFFDASGRMSFANPASLRMAGVNPSAPMPSEDVDFSKFLDMRDASGRAHGRETAPYVRALAGETVTELGSITQAGTGRRLVLQTTAAPVRDSEGRLSGAVVVSRDVTEEVEFERLKDQFVEVAAHELKTPVAIMKTNAQLLRTASELSPTQSEMARAIDRGANRIDKIVQELLDISQLQLGKFTLSTVDFDLGALVGRVVRRVASTSTAHVLRFDPPKAVLVRADPHRIEWIVTHILENALRYSPGGGVVEIGVARGDTPTLSIRDSGVGIPVERQLRIFERFYRAHTGTPHDVGGLGVSLYISREIVHRSGGEMWFESEPGKGSTFFVRLPGGAANGADTHDRPRRG